MSLENVITRFYQDYSSRRLQAAEYCAALLLTPQLRLQNKSLFPQLSTQSVIIDHLNRYHWIGHSDRIRRALIQWYLGHYPLHLCFYIPTPLEILKRQACGERVVTAFNTIEDWNKTWGPHDSWNFIAHDLIHADHFFSHPENRKGQIQFYKAVLKYWSHPDIQALHNNLNFEYLISDMNSHPLHMLETLNSLLIRSKKNQLNLSDHDRLDQNLENQIQDFMIQIKNAMETF